MFLDTSGLLTLIDHREPLHRDAVGHFDGARRRLTHDYVVAEFVAVANSRGVPRAAALAFARRLTSDPDIRFVWVTEAVHVAAVDLLDARADKDYSLCDAVSFLLMRR